MQNNPEHADNFKPCLLIPVYNHGLQLKKYLPSLIQYQLDIVLVNDGSDEQTTAILAELDAEFACVQLVSLAENGGKGAAVMAGIAYCETQGFSHALQIDADGQHDSNDIPKFLAAAEAAPSTVISGQPVYDDSVPKKRLYARYITHVWVWIETLSFDIKDSMCGFRVYPLNVMSELIRDVKLGTRMDFDVEALVHLYWRGVNVKFIPTKVLYPDDGLSHFNVLKDNLLITAMHTQLVCLMLLKLPKVLKNLVSGKKPFAGELSSSEGHWAIKQEKGSMQGMKIMLACYKFLGKRWAYILLYPVILFFFISAKQARQESQRFLQRAWASRQTQELPPNLLTTYRHLLSFGRAMVDRFGVWSNDMQHSELHIHNEDSVDRILGLKEDNEGKPKRGCVFFTSHLGNVDIMRGLLQRYPNLKLTVLLFAENAVKINALMKDVSGSSALNIISVAQITPATAMMLNDRIEAGECVAIAVDRTQPEHPNMPVNSVPNCLEGEFLGMPAVFPTGPFILASLLDCAVYTLFCIHDEGRYHLHLRHFSEKIDLPRRKRGALLPALVQQYADELTYFAQKYPLQWFNFFNFWQESPVIKQHKNK